MRFSTGMAAIALVAIVAGCEKKDQEAALAQGQQLANSAEKLAGTARDSASKEAAATIKSIKAEMDKRVEDAKKLKDNATKKVDDIRDQLSKTNAEYQDLQKRLSEAQKTYDNVTTKIHETTDKISNL